MGFSIIPPVKEWPVEFELPSLGSVSDVVAVMAAVMQAASKGKILLSQAVEFGKLLEMFARTTSDTHVPWPINLTDEQLRSEILRLQAALATDAEVFEATSEETNPVQPE